MVLLLARATLGFRLLGTPRLITYAGEGRRRVGQRLVRQIIWTPKKMQPRCDAAMRGYLGGAGTM